MDRPEAEEEEVVRANGERGRVGIVALGDMGGSSGPTSQRHTAMVTATATRAARTRGDAGRWIRIGRLSSRANLKQTASRLVDIFIVVLLYIEVDCLMSHTYRLIFLSNMSLLFLSVPNQLTSNMYLYLSNIRSAFISDNICIDIHIRFENMEIEVVGAVSNPYHP